MSFPSGLYTLRASPAVGHGGLYATGNGVNDVVTVAPQSPSVIERQVWNIQAVLGKEGTYTITLDGGHWSPKDGHPIPERPVVTSKNSYEWFIAYKNIPGVPHTITIQAPNPRIGVDFYAGTNDNLKEQVVIIPVPVIPHAEAPYWQYKPHLVS